MKKVIKQDGTKGIFIYDDGTTAPINGESKKVKEKKTKTKKETVSIKEASDLLDIIED